MQFVCMRACVYNHHTSSCVLKQTAQHTNTRPPCPLCPQSWLRTIVQIFFCRLFSFLLARCPCIARNIKMHLYDLFILWEKRMNEGRPYLQMWRGVWVPFCKIAIVSFLSVKYKSDGLYCRMAGTRSSPTMLFIRVGIKNRVGDDGGPAILQCRSSDLYLTDREENMAIYPHSSPHLQIRPSLVHPFLPQDLDGPCNARASC